MVSPICYSHGILSGRTLTKKSWTNILWNIAYTILHWNWDDSMRLEYGLSSLMIYSHGLFAGQCQFSE